MTAKLGFLLSLCGTVLLFVLMVVFALIEGDHWGLAAFSGVLTLALFVMSIICGAEWHWEIHHPKRYKE